MLKNPLAAPCQGNDASRRTGIGGKTSGLLIILLGVLLLPRMLNRCNSGAPENVSATILGQLAGLLTGRGSSGLSVEPSGLAGARNVLRYIVTALASASLSPSAGILVSAFIACGFFIHR